jgi:hypothetical protein
VSKIANYLSKKIVKLKRFIGLDRTNISGYLYLVNLEITIINSVLNRIIQNKIKNLKIVVKVTSEENKLSKTQFEQLITSRSRTQVKEYYKDLMVFNEPSYISLQWSGIIDKLDFMRICPVYTDACQESV